MIKISLIILNIFIFGSLVMASSTDDPSDDILVESGHEMQTCEEVGDVNQDGDNPDPILLQPAHGNDPFGVEQNKPEDAVPPDDVFGVITTNQNPDTGAKTSDVHKPEAPLCFRIIKNGFSVLSTFAVPATGALSLAELPWDSLQEEALLKCIFGTMTMGGVCLFDASINLTFGCSIIAGLLDCCSVKNAFGKVFTVGSMFMFISAGLGFVDAPSLPTLILIQTIGRTVGSLLVLDSSSSMVDWFNSRWLFKRLQCCKSSEEDAAEEKKSCLMCLDKTFTSPWAEFTPGSTAIFIMNALGWLAYNEKTTTLQFITLIVSTVGGFLFAFMSGMNWFESVVWNQTH